MIGFLRSISSLKTTHGKRLAVASTVGLVTLLGTQRAMQGGHAQAHAHDDHHHHHHHRATEVPFEISNSLVLTEDPKAAKERRSKIWTMNGVFALGLGYALWKTYCYGVRNGGKPLVVGSVIGFSYVISLLSGFNIGKGNLVKEIAVNRDLTTMSVRTGLANDRLYEINIRDVRPVNYGHDNSFKAIVNGRSKTFILPDEKSFDNIGLRVTHHQLFRDLVSGNSEAVRKYHFED